MQRGDALNITLNVDLFYRSVAYNIVVLKY